MYTGRSIKDVFFVLVSIGILASLVFYVVYFRNSVSEFLSNGTTSFWTDYVDMLYPRYQVERHRFNTEFFLSKVDQIAYRVFFVYLVVASILYLKQFRKYIHTILVSPSSEASLYGYQLIFLVVITMSAYDWWWAFDMKSSVGFLYVPIGSLRWLGTKFLDVEFIRLALMMLPISTLLYVVTKKRVFVLLGSVAFVYTQGLFLSFQKIDHGYVPLIYCGLGLMIIQFCRIQSVELIRLLILMCYTFTGLEKIFTGGVVWFQPSTLKGHLLAHPTSLGLYMSTNEWLCTTASIAVVLFQISAVLCWFTPKYRLYWIVLACMFHLGVWMTMGVGWWIHPWTFTFFFFIPEKYLEINIDALSIKKLFQQNSNTIKGR